MQPLVSLKAQLEDLEASFGIQVDPNLGDYDDRTALHLAASNGHLDTIQWLGAEWQTYAAIVGIAHSEVRSLCFSERAAGRYDKDH